MNFTQLNLHKDVLMGIEDAGFTHLMPVQEETFKHSLKGRDVTVQSQTGTGKTAAFLVTIFQHFQTKQSFKNRKALIVTPTRELAIQIENEAKLLGRHLNLTIGSFYGGVGYYHQEMLLKQGVDVVIGTPGRLLDFNSQKKLNFKNIGFLVIDEADRMFDMGFLPDIKKIIRHSSPSSKRQTMLFSATLGRDTRELASNFMNQPVSIWIRPEEVAVNRISQVLYHVGSREKINLVLGILKKEAPKNALIFTNMKRDTVQVANHLDMNGHKCMHISGDLTQKKRISVLEKFRAGKVPFLVATDVAARGLHIDDLEMIINYDLPGDCENYVHRIGRTARAGKSGKAITFACEKYIFNLEAIESFLNMKIPVGYVSDDMFLESKSKGLRFGVNRKQKRSKRKMALPSKAKKYEFLRKKDMSNGADRRRNRSAVNKRTVKSSWKIDRKISKKGNFKQQRSTIEERLAYYSQKYGDKFKSQTQGPTSGDDAIRETG
ncbi:MAG: DEAD/DEAH box helicase [Candidatus Aminicenantes bacterium]|nr:DEAD/DEAH box helicase [Candidatus Aminicenantes bacterium]